MRLAGRVQAAIEILAEIQSRHRPSSEALKDWGKAHRFAGSADRHAIGTLVYDSLRQRNSSSFRMSDDTPRATVFGTLLNHWGVSSEQLLELSQDQHGPGALSAKEKILASAKPVPTTALHVAGDIPEWLAPAFDAQFGLRAAEEGAALARRAPIDLRVNQLKATREQVLEALRRFDANPGPWSADCVRISAPSPDQKHVNVEAEPAHGMGWYEVQDAASQVAAHLSGAKPGESIADICAGAGGKTLALASMMKNEGRLVAHDKDRHRLRPIFERIARSGATNIEVLAAENEAGLSQGPGFDCVLIDAPCTGSGAWRRKPDSKWRLTPKTLTQRLADQRLVLERGASLVKPGGRLVYVTCSVLAAENTEQIAAFLGVHKNYRIIPFAEQWAKTIGSATPVSADGAKNTLLLTPRSHDTDGFFVSVVQRNG